MASKRNWGRGLFAACYWIGIALTVACCTLILASNTDWVWRLEHVGVPLSWACGGVAVLAFLAAEFCHSILGHRGETEDRTAELVAKSEAPTLTR
jgi:hypothetical protein